MKVPMIAALLLVFCCAAPVTAFVLSYDENDSGVPGLPSVLEQVQERDEVTPAPTTTEVVGESDDPLSLYTALARDAVDGVSGSLASAGNGTGVVEVVAYPLITDSDLADPVYLGRSMGVKVVVVYPADGDCLQNTLWWYEKDATTIVRTLYNGETVDPPGFVAVVFRKAGEEDTSLKLVLNAVDASSVASGTNETYIRNIDWSEAEVSPGVSVTGYEPPDSAIEWSEAGSDAASQTLTLDALKAEVANGTNVMNTKIDEISRAAGQEDYTNVAQLSDDLIGLARDREKNLQDCTVPTECAPAFSEYCAGLRKYQDAGSLLWYGATFGSSDAFSRGNDYLVDGQAQIGSALEKLSISAPALETSVDAGSQSLYPNALSLEDRYKFKTASEGNTISVKIGPITRVDQYFTKTDDDTINETLPSYGKEFFCVLVEINHLGYGGKGSQTFKTPKASAFTLLLNGEKYLPEQPTAYMESVGSVYSAVTLNRKDRTIGYLVYEVPEGTDPASAYLQVNFGTAGGSPVWKLG